MAIVSLDGTVRPLATAAMIADIEPSPDGRYILVEAMHRPFSYVVPESRFPRRIEVWDRDGNVVHRLADLVT